MTLLCAFPARPRLELRKRREIDVVGVVTEGASLFPAGKEAIDRVYIVYIMHLQPNESDADQQWLGKRPATLLGCIILQSVSGPALG